MSVVEPLDLWRHIETGDDARAAEAARHDPKALITAGHGMTRTAASLRLNQLIEHPEP